MIMNRFEGELAIEVKIPFCVPGCIQRHIFHDFACISSIFLVFQRLCESGDALGGSPASGKYKQFL